MSTASLPSREIAPDAEAGRLGSLDLFRGLTMFLLVAEAAGVYRALGQATSADSLPGMLVSQFHHHPWHGLRFWDLVQPFFMFIVAFRQADRRLQFVMRSQRFA